jgi:hypothetical protein
VGSAPYFRVFDTTNETPGDYDFEAVATEIDGSGHTTTATTIVTDRVIANDATFVALSNPGLSSGTIHLLATPENGAISTPTQVDFQIAAAGTNNWHTFPGTAELNHNGFPDGRFFANLDTTATLPDGTKITDGLYDFNIVPSDDSGDPFVALPVRGVQIDNTAPTSTLTVPPGPLSNLATLTASAQDAGSGVASITFQVATADSGNWKTLATRTTSPTTFDFDTRSLQDGTYDFRVFATDAAGNTAPSPVVRGVAISNPSKATFGNVSLTNFVAPATNISLLGSISGSPDHETWAYGDTTAPPAAVGGSTLTYCTPDTCPAGTKQLVILRYTDETGWQIVDVLRNADGTSAFGLDLDQTITGAMTGSGDGWIALTQGQPGAIKGYLFHKDPGSSHFVLDTNADTLAITNMMTSGGQSGMHLSVGEDAQGPYGLLLVPQQTHPQVPVPAPSGGSVRITENLDYGVLDQNDTWSLKTARPPPSYVPSANDQLSLAVADLTGRGAGWGAVTLTRGGQFVGPLLLAQFDNTGAWHYVPRTGFDPFDLTGQFVSSPTVAVQPTAIHADSAGVWISAILSPGNVIARYDRAAGRVTASWCSSGIPHGNGACDHPLDANNPAAIPQGVFDTASGQVALALASGFVDVYSYGTWKSVAAPGFDPNIGQPLFTSPTDGWIVGTNGLARVSAQPAPSPLASWPEANQSTLLGVALPPAGAGIETSGPLAVGLQGAALHYDANAGWIADPTPQKAQHVALRGVAFSGPSSAVAVGDLGTILDWNGSSWSEDPQSISLTQVQLNAVAFSGGQGWAVGSFGTILHFNGASWSPEQIDAQDQGVPVTSVTIAGQDVFAIAGGNLIERGADGTWRRVDPTPPSPAPAVPDGSLRLVAGLPDGGLVVAGKSEIIVREGAGSPFQYADQPIQGIPVGLAAFRSGGQMRAFVSVAPPVLDLNGNPTGDIAGFPSGDGELFVENGAGFDDLSRAQFPGTGVPVDGAVIPDPVLGVAAAPDGSAAWAVGGYAGTQTAGSLGTLAPLSGRTTGWQTSAIWRYDSGGSATSPAVKQATVNLPAAANTVSFAFFSSSLCRSECAAVRDAQPSVNLTSAAKQISTFAQQPGGPSFAILGGDAVGPINQTAFTAGNGAIDFANLNNSLAPLGNLPLFAAYGPRDGVPSSADPTQPWADAFFQAPGPFGLGAVPRGITPTGAGGATGSVHRYYAFDASQNGGTLRVIVLDNSASTLESSDPGQTAWLQAQLAGAAAAHLPVVVVAARPLNPVDAGAAADGSSIAAVLASAGVLGVFTTSGTNFTNQLNRVATIGASPGIAGIPEYEGATLGYQQSQNDGVEWYSVSVDTAARKLSVQAIPIVQSLALKPLAGLTVPRSSTLAFSGVGRRPAGTIATTIRDTNSSFPGFENYVQIPAATCTGCVGPSYTFESSNPGIGDFVVPSAAGSLFPKLDTAGHPTHSATSGLFCAYNAGTTTVSVTSGVLTSSLPVTVQAGGVGRPCGTVNIGPGGTNVTVLHPKPIIQSATPETPSGVAPPPINPNPGVGSIGPITINPPPLPIVVPPVVAPPVTPHPPVKPPPPPVQQPVNTAVTTVPIPPPPPSAQPVVVPPIPPAVTPVPPGGATASAQASARREEKARKHASQSAYAIRPAGSSATDWFYPTLGIVTVIAMMLIAGGISRGARRERPAFAWETVDRQGRPRR